MTRRRMPDSHVTGGAILVQENLYELLGVPLTATREDIRTAYRQLAKSIHPDKNRSNKATSSFQNLHTAYQVLSNERSRRAYYFLLLDSGYLTVEDYLSIFTDLLLTASGLDMRSSADLQHQHCSGSTSSFTKGESNDQSSDSHSCSTLCLGMCKQQQQQHVWPSWGQQHRRQHRHEPIKLLKAA